MTADIHEFPTVGVERVKRPPIKLSPVVPLGVSAGKCFVLSARGELREISAQHLEKGNSIWELFAGGEVEGEPATDWLATFFPARERGRKDGDDGVDPFAPARLDARLAGRWLIEECTAVGLYNPNQEIRKLGMWRGEDGPILNAGEALVSLAGVEPAGQVLGRIPYPAQYRGDFPTLDELEFEEFSATGRPSVREEFEVFRDELNALFAWQRPIDGDVILGWIGNALLGAFPDWRAHIWIAGAGNTGKSTLFEIMNSLLGPMIDSKLTNSTAAGIRAGGNRTARPYLFDESEPEANPGRLDQLIEMFRHMSGTGALVQRSTAGLEARSFAIHGAAAMFSIVAAPLKAQDMMRFVHVWLNPIPEERMTREMRRRVNGLKKMAARLGKRLWLHAFGRAAVWDAHFEAYQGLVMELGGTPRMGDTIGAVLAGYDLLLSDLLEPDDERLDAATEMALPLIEAASAATEENTAERCLHRLFSSEVSLGGGEQRSIARMIIAAQNGGGARNCPFQAKLERVGLKWIHDKNGREPCLRVIAGEHPMLERIFAGTDFARGAHVGALRLIEGVSAQTVATRIGGISRRALSIPARYVPCDPDAAET